MSVFKTHIRATTLVLLTAILFFACTKIDTTSVGSGLIPGVDNIHTFDTTFDIIANNFDTHADCDSVSPGDLQALGVISNNPLFGKMKANMYFELKPSVYPASLPTHDTLSLVVDSVVLILKYSHSYGDTTIPQKVQVFDLAQNLRADSAYKTCTALPQGIDLLGESVFTPSSLKDSIHAFRENDAKQLRIRINNDFGTNFIDNISKFKSDSAFEEYFKGFAVIADETYGGEALNYFSLTSSATRLAIYTRSKRDTIKDTTVINLTFNLNSGSANYINIDRAGSEITQHLTPKTEGDSLIFIQTAPGSYALLNIPGLSSFPNSVIHRAELIVDQVADPGAARFETPATLYLQIEDPKNPGKYIPVPCDFTFSDMQSGLPYFGGSSKNAGDGNGNMISRYTFNLSRYVQSIVTRGTANSTLKLSAPYYILNMQSYADACNQLVSPFSTRLNAVADGGVKLNGSIKGTNRIRLHIIYSKL